MPRNKETGHKIRTSLSKWESTINGWLGCFRPSFSCGIVGSAWDDVRADRLDPGSNGQNCSHVGNHRTSRPYSPVMGQTCKSPFVGTAEVGILQDHSTPASGTENPVKFLTACAVHTFGARG